MTGNKVRQLEQVALFSGLDEDDLQTVAKLARRQRYPAGKLICRQGEPGHRWYLVEAGRLCASHVDPEGIEHEVGRFGPGDFFGESSLLLGGPHDATIQVVEDATLLYVDKEDLDQLLEQRPWILDDLQMDPETERRRSAPRFDWQEPDEAVVFVLHKHNVILLQRLILPATLLLLILAAYLVVGGTSILGLVVAGVLASAPLLCALYQIVDHFNDNYILTNKRVMHDEHVFLIHQSRVGAPLSRIQSIQVSQQGALAQSLNFGDLHIETAGRPRGRVLFQQIPDPEQAQEMIFEERQRAQALARAEERAAIQDALDRRFGQRPPEEEPSDEIDDEEKSSETDRGFNWRPWLRAPVKLVRYFYPSLWEEEGDMITWRKHWIALLGPIAPPTILIVLATGAGAWLLRGEESARGSILVGYGIVLMFLVPWWLWVFEDWQNEMYQVTPSRIIDIEQSPFALREERREASLGMIQNVNLKVPSMIGRLLGYGTVTIETAGTAAFTFDHVKNPREVQAEIFRRMAAFEHRERQQEAQRRRDELLDWFAVYDQMRHPAGDQRGRPGLPGSPGQTEASDAPSSS